MADTLRGADISFDGAAKAMKAAGLAFAQTECSIGMGENPSGVRNIEAFRNVGLLAGLYHYCIFTNDVEREIDALIARVLRIEAQCGRLDLAIELDVEQPKSRSDLTLPLPAPQIIKWLVRAAQKVREGLNHRPIFYGYPAYWKMLDVPELADPELGACPLNLADYDHGLFPDDSALGMIFNARTPEFVNHNPWSRWTMMQTGGNARLTGIPHIVDVDVFAGTAEQLKATRDPLTIDAGPIVHPDVDFPSREYPDGPAVDRDAPTVRALPDVPDAPPSDVGPITNE